MRKIRYVDLKAGDDFWSPQTSRRAPIGGKIISVARGNFTYEAIYAPRPGFEQKLTLTTAKSEVIGGQIKRNGIIYNVVD